MPIMPRWPISAMRCAQFLAFSEARAAECGLTPQQHQALLAIRGAAPRPVSIGYVAERLILKPHSASGLVDRLEALGLVVAACLAGRSAARRCSN